MSATTRTNLFLDLAIFIALLLAATPALTGLPIHEWLSLAFAAAILVHLVLHWDWMAGFLPRFFKKLLREPRLNFIVDLLFFVALIAIMLSGVLISKFAAPALGLRFPAGRAWRLVHKYAADAALALLGVHCAMHWRWIAQNFMSHVWRPAEGLLNRGARLEAGKGEER